jgi:HEAT repeat protein
MDKLPCNGLWEVTLMKLTDINWDSFGSTDVRQLRREMRKLIRQGDNALRLIASHINDPRPLVRCRIAMMLGYFDDPQAYQFVARLVEDSDRSVRYDALTALGELRNPAALPLLLAEVRKDDDTWGWSSAAAHSISKFGAQAVELLEAELPTFTRSVMVRVAYILGKTKEQAAERLLRNMLPNGAPEVVAAVLEGLVTISAPDICLVLKQYKESSDDAVAEVAREWLRRLDCDAA